MTNDQSPKTTLISDGVIIGIFTLIGYKIAYNYNLGYMLYYNIPGNLIEITIPGILNSITVVLSSIVTLIALINVVPILLPEGETPLGKSIKRLLILVTCFFILSYLSSFEFNVVIMLLIVLLFFILIELILPLLFHIKVKGYQNKLSAASEGDKKISDIFSLIARKFGIKNFMFIFCFIILLLSSPYYESLGEKGASNQKEYLTVTVFSVPYVIINTYKDYYIMLKVNRQNLTFENSFLLMKQDDEKLKNKKFKYEELGKLRSE
jgi:hypothetical protein